MVNKSIFKNKLNIKILAALMLMVSVFIPNTALANTAVDNLMEQANNANEMLMMANDLDAGDIVPTIPAEIALDITNTSWNVSKTAEDNVMIYLVADDENANKYKLVVEGTGEMMDLAEFLYAATDLKWYAYAHYIYEIEIKEGVTSVGDKVFSGLWNLEKLSLPSTLEWIGYSAFSNCEDLKQTIELSKNFTHMSEAAFYTTPIEAFHVEDGSINFSSYDGVLYNKQAGGGLEIYPMGKTGSSYTVLEGITYISPMAFSYSSVSNVILPESLQTLHYAAFQNSNITSIVIPENVRVIEWAVFRGSKLLETVYLNSSKINYMDTEIFSDIKPGSAVYTKNKAMADKFIADVHYTSAYTQMCYPPEIAFDLRNAASGIGKNATFTIEVIPGNPNDTTYNWQYRTSSSDTWKDVTDAQGTGIGTPSFTTITVTEEMLQYEYRCVIGCGNYPNQEMTFDELEERFVSNAARILEAEKLMITEWTIPEGGATIKLPVTGEVDIVVDWADGNVETIKGTFTKDNLPEHTFTRGGKKEIWVSGKVGVWGFSSSEDTGTQYLTGLKHWGELGASKYSFAYCENLEYVLENITEHTFDNLTSMGNMFYDCKSLVSLDLSYMDTSNVTAAYWMFANCSSLTSLKIDGFNLEKANENLSYMFLGCSALEELDLSNVTFGKVGNICGMFESMHLLKNINLKNFDTSNCYSMAELFAGCRSLESLDLSGFNTSNVETMNNMFSTCASLKSLNLSSFNTSKVTSMTNMFYDCSELRSIQISNKFVVPTTNTDMFINTPNLSAIIITSKDASGDQFAAVKEQIPYKMFYVPNDSESAYEEAFASYNEDKVRPILGTTKAPALIAIGGTYIDDTYITIADFDNSQKEYYEPYGYTLTKAGEVKTDTLGTYTRTYTLNRTYIGDTENITEKVAETTRDVVVGSANYSVNGNFYTSLAHAYMAIEGAEGTIVVEASNTDDSEFIVEPGKTVILDTNGKTITKTEVGIVNNGTLTIEGNGTIETLDVDNNKISVLIYNNNSLEINEVNIIHKGYDLTNSWNYIIYSYGNLTINGGNLKVTGNVGEYNRGIVVTSLGKLNMMSGSIINEGSGIAIVSDTYQGTEINIYDGTIRGGYYTIYLENSANYTVNNTTLNIYGGTIESRLSGYAIANYYGKKVNIYGGNIKSNIGGAIYSRITDSITIGTSGDSVSTTSPVIQGATYGINSTNDINFYDGIIKGKDGAINGNAITEANYVVIKESELIDGVSYETAFPAIGWDVSKTPGTDNVWAYLVEEAENAGKYKLVVSGTGAMVDLEEILFVETDKKWYAYAEDIYEVEIKEGVTNLGDRTFNGFWNIEKITFSSTLERIGNFAVAYCDSLKGTIEIPKSVTFIAENAFYYTPIEAITVEEGNTVYRAHEGVLYNNLVDDGLVLYPIGKTGSSYTVLDGIKYISALAFFNTSVSNVILPESLEIIHYSAFQNSKITSITIPENVRNIEWAAFMNSSELETVYLNSKEIDFMDTEVFNNIKPGSIIYTKSKSIADKFVADTHYTSAKTSIYYPPEITTQPKDADSEFGNTATFSIAATAGVPNDITYTWQYRTSSDGEWQNATSSQGTGYNTATFTTVAVTAEIANYEYRCLIESSAYPNEEMTVEELGLVSNTVKVVAEQGNYSVNGVSYQTLADAYAGLKAAGTTGEIIVNQDVPDEATEVTIDDGYTVTLNLQTNTLTMSKRILNSGTLTIKGKGEIILAEQNTYGYCIENRTNGTLNINEAMIKACVANRGVSNIYSGTILMDGLDGLNNHCISNYKELNIYGGTLKITANNENNNYAIYASGATVNMYSGEIIDENTNSNYGIFLESNSAFNMYGGKASFVNERGIQINDGATLNMTGGTIKSAGRSIYVLGKANIFGGTIEGDAYAVRGAGTTAIINIGSSGDTVSTSSPELICGTNAIKTDNGFNFYDGILKGGTVAIAGTAPTTEPGYAVYTENSGKTAYLKKTIASGDVTLSGGPFTYDGNAKTPTPTVTWQGATLTAGTDYKVTYANNTNAGTEAKVIITGSGDYMGTVEKTFTINKATGKLTLGKESLIARVGYNDEISYTYEGDGEITVTASPEGILNVNEEGNKIIITGVAEGTATVTVSAIGTNYTDVSEIINVTSKIPNYIVNGEYYATLAEAYAGLKASGTSGEIIVNVDTSETMGFEIDDGYEVTLNTNGHKITLYSGIINNYGTLTVKGNGTIEGLATNGVMLNSGTLNINDVEIINYGINNTEYFVLANMYEPTAVINVNGGTIKALSSGDSTKSFGIYQKIGTVNVNSGEVINNTTSTSESYAIAGIADTAGITNEVNINGGTISGSLVGIGGYNSTFNVNGGTISAPQRGGHMISSNIEMTDGSVSGNVYGMHVVSSTLNVNGGTIEGFEYGLVGEGSIINVTDGTITGAKTGVGLNPANLTVTGGTIKGQTKQAILNNGAGTVIIGTSGDAVSTESPVIEGATIGIESANGIQFYDGIIKGIDGAVNGNITTEPNYGVIKESDVIDGVTYEIATPTIGWNVSKTAQDNVWVYLVENEENEGEYKLVVEGTGEMMDFAEYLHTEDDQKWYTYAKDIYEIEIKEGVTAVGDRAFAVLYNLEKISLPSTLGKIGCFVFAYCEKLKQTIEIPKNTIDILEGPFLQTPIEAINVEEGNIHFSSYEGVLYNKQAGGGIALYPMGKTGSSYTVLDGIKYISPNAFAYASVSNVILPESLEVIYGSAFLNSKITSITIPENVRNIEWGIFKDSTELETVYLNSKEIDFMNTEVFNNIKPGSIIYTTSKAIADKFVADTHYTSANTTIYYPPEITTQPTNQKVVVGNKATFTIAATAGVPNDTTYTWQYRTSSEGEWQNATEAQGTGYNTATFTTVEVTEEMANYEYRCVIGSSAYPNAEMTQEELAESLVSDTVKIVDTSKSMITEWTIPEGGATIKLPVTGAVDIVVDWGDGEVQEIKGTFTSGDMPEHKYTTSGEKEITISGTIGNWGLVNPKKLSDIVELDTNNPYYTSTKYLTGVKQLGELEASRYSFANCMNLLYVSGDTTSTKNTFKNITDMSNMFLGCQNLLEIDLRSFDTSKVTTFEGMFNECYAIKELDFSSFRTENVTNMSKMFRYCGINLKRLDLKMFITSQVTTMYSMFNGCNALEYLDVSSFDTSNVTNMKYMFNSLYKLTTLDLKNFDTSKVTDMYGMFAGGSSLTSLDVSSFNTTNVTDMCAMFRGCNDLASLDVSKFNTSKVTNMKSMFYECNSLTSLDVSKFDTSSVESFNGMFASCNALESLDVSSFDTSKVTDMAGMFYMCSSLKSLDVSSFNAAKVTRMNKMLEGCTSLGSIQISNKFVVPTTCPNMFSGDTNLTAIIITSKTPSGDQFANATAVLPSQVNFYVPNDSESAYETAFASYDANRVRPIFTATNTDVILNNGETYIDDTYVTIAEFDKSQKEYYEPYGYKVTASGDVKTDTPGTYTRTYTLTRTYNSGDAIFSTNASGEVIVDESNIEEVTEFVAETKRNVEVIDQNKYMITEWTIPEGGATIKLPVTGAVDIVVDWGDGEVQEIKGTFTRTTFPEHEYKTGGEKEITICGTIGSWGYANYAKPEQDSGNYKEYYTYTKYLTGVKQFGELNATNYGFAQCANLTYISGDNLVTDKTFEKVRDMSNMFRNCSGLTELDVSNWNIGSVQIMSYMFYSCSRLTSLDVSNWNVGSVTDMSMMFGYCNGLISLDVSDWNTRNVRNMRQMFSSCSSLTSLYVSNWSTENVRNMSQMFSSCSSLTSLDVSNWNTGNVTEMQYIFNGCSSLTSLDVSNWNTGSAINMDFMFNECSGLTSLDVSNWNTGKVQSMQFMFRFCSGLTSLDLSNWNTGSVTDMNWMFAGCSALRSIQVSSKFTVPTSCTQMFETTTNLTAIIITSGDTNGDQFANAKSVLPGKVNFYVPNTLEVAYETAFASYGADRIRPILTATNTTVILQPGATYVDDTNVTIAEFDNSQKEYYESYGYKVTASGDVKTGTIGIYERIYTLTRTYNSGDAIFSTNASGEIVVDTSNIEKITDFVAETKRDVVVDVVVDVEPEKKMITEWTIPEGGATIKLPVTGAVDIVVDWGDGKVEEIKGTFTSGDMPEHEYTTGGEKEITISGTIGEWGYSSNAGVSSIQNENYLTYTQYLTGVKQFGELNATRYGFAQCDNLTYVSGDNLVTDNTFINVKAMNHMFFWCKNLTTLDVSKWDVSSVTNMSYLFNNCTGLTTLDVSDWDVSNVTNMSGVFYGCTGLTKLDVSKWDVSSVTNMSSVFYYCSALITLDVSKWDVSSVTDMSRLFYYCTKLTTLDVSNWNVSSVTNMSSVFNSCSSLTALDVSRWDVSSVTNMSSLFASCINLTTLNLNNWDTSKVTDVMLLFLNCSKLASMQISNKFVVPTTNTSMFTNTRNLTSIIITSAIPSGDQFAAVKTQLSGKNFYVPNDSEGAYETAFAASFSGDRVRPILTSTNTTVELMEGDIYLDDTYVTIAEFDKSQKEFYEPYGYKVTASGDVKTDTPGTYTRTYTLTRTYESGDAIFNTNANGDVIVDTSKIEEVTETVATRTRNVIVKAINITTLEGNTDILPPTGNLVVRDAVKENNVNLVESQVVVVEIYAQDNTCTGNGDIWYYLSVGPIVGNIPESEWKVYSEGVTETITLEKVGLTYGVYMVLKDKYGNVSGTYINEKYTVMFDANGGKAAPLPQSVKFGTPLYLTYEKPYYDGKYFMGWSTVQGSSMEDYEGTILYRQGDVIPANTFTSQNTTLYAVWADRTSQLPRLADMVKVGDYVEYPVHYENVTAGTLKQGWKVLSIEEDGTVNLVSAGIPMTYKNGGNTETATRNLTTNFLETPFTLAEDNTFKKNGFNPYITLTENFTNEYTAIEEGKLKVRAMMKEDAADGADILATGEISIRPVVSLKPNVRTTGLDATRAWEIEL